MRTKILVTAFLIILVTVVFAPAVLACEKCPPKPCDKMQMSPPGPVQWEEEKSIWADVDYTELDFRGIDYLLGRMEGGATVAILPFTDYSDESLISTPMGGDKSAAVRRLCEELAWDFTYMGILPIPYDDCYDAVETVLFGNEINEAGINNSLHLGNKSSFMMSALEEHSPGVLRGWAHDVNGISLSRDDIVQIAEILGADIIIRGSISEYGMERKIEANLRTFLPPFLGVFNPEKEGLIELGLYMYDGPSGEMIWAAFENIENAPAFPLFRTDFEIMSKAEGSITRRLISHLAPPPFAGCGHGMMMGMGGPHGGMMGMGGHGGMMGMGGPHGKMMGMGGECGMMMGMGGPHGGMGMMGHGFGCRAHPGGHQGIPDHEWDGKCKLHPDGHDGVPPSSDCWKGQWDMKFDQWDMKCDQWDKTYGDCDKKYDGHRGKKFDHGDKKCDGHGDKKKCKDGDEPCEKGDQCCKVTGKECDDCDKKKEEEAKEGCQHKKKAS